MFLTVFQLFFASFALCFEAFLEFFHIVFVVFEVFAECATTAVDAVGRRFAGGLLESHISEAVFFFAKFADAFAGLFVGFLSESRGDLESVEVDTRLAAVDTAGGECAEFVKRS